LQEIPVNPAEYKKMYEAEDSHWWYVGLHEHVLGLVRGEYERLGRPLGICDAGCGTGRLCRLMSAYGEVAGVDASEDALKFCRERRVSATHADLNELQLTADGLDLITSIDVLYHADIRDDVAVLRQLNNALRPGGMLIVQVPAFEFIRSTHDDAVHSRERYTVGSLKERLSAAGFSVQSIFYRVSLLFPFIALYRLLGRRISGSAVSWDTDSDVRLPHPLVNLLLLEIIRRENGLSTICHLPFGTSVFAVARKKAGPVLSV
jgi:SAM-dependent methyltransferase